MSKKKNKKKEKIKYVDDGRTIADMSGTSKTNLFFGGTVKRGGGKDSLRSSRADQLKTYVSAMKSMFVPMLVTMGIIAAAFGLMFLALILFG